MNDNSLLFRQYDEHRLSGGFESEEIMAEAYTKAVSYTMFTLNDYKTGFEEAGKAKKIICECIEKGGKTLWEWEDEELRHQRRPQIIFWYYQLCLLRSFWSLEDFIFFMEMNRPQEKRFYLPRVNPLRIIVWDFEDLIYRYIKFLGVSLPSRVGKSTIALFALAWASLRDPDLSSAIGSHSGILAKGFYSEMYNFLTSAEYTYGDIYRFWHKNKDFLEDKSSEYLYLNLGSPSRFSTMVFRGIDGTWTGAINVSHLLIVDDLIRDREHSLSPTRCENTWQEYLNKMIDRKSGQEFNFATLIRYEDMYNILRRERGQEEVELTPFAGALEAMIGTLWNVYDPLCRMEKLYGDDPLYRFRKIPALNENDETNFEYQYTTAYLHDMREKLDAPEWMAKWQQAPYVREGLLYQPNELLYFNGECGKGKTISVLDPAVGGGDYLSMLIIRTIGKKKLIIDWLYTNETKGKTIPAICNKIIFHEVTELHFERNGIGRAFEEDVTKALHERNYYRCKAMPFNAPEGMSKEDKILGYSDWVKANLWFIAEDAKSTTYSRSQDYVRAMNDMFIYTTVGKNKHDDSVDNLAQAARVFEKSSNGVVDVILNPFR